MIDSQITSLIPHRPPFLWVDRILEATKDSIVAEKKIPENLEVFKGHRPVQEETEEGVVVDYLKEYEVNVILDNSRLKTCPVVIETSPTFSNLFGAIEKLHRSPSAPFNEFGHVPKEKS